MSNVSDVAILAHLEMRFSKFEKTDRRISTEMATLKGAKDGIFKTHRGLFPGCDAPHKALLASMETVRTVHERNSSPWPPTRAVVLTHYTKHRDRVNEAINQFTIQFTNFESQYDYLVQQGIKNSNGLNAPEEYMPKDQLSERFTITMTYDQLTDANNWFKSSLQDPTIQQELAAQTKAAQARILAGASNAIKDQFCNILKSAKDNLEKTTSKQEGQRFNTAWLGNLQQFCELWPGLNLAQDPLVPQMIVALEPITKHTQETMKTSKVAQLEAYNTLIGFIADHDAWLNS